MEDGDDSYTDGYEDGYDDGCNSCCLDENNNGYYDDAWFVQGAEILFCSNHYLFYFDISYFIMIFFSMPWCFSFPLTYFKYASVGR